MNPVQMQTPRASAIDPFPIPRYLVLMDQPTLSVFLRRFLGAGLMFLGAMTIFGLVVAPSKIPLSITQGFIAAVALVSGLILLSHEIVGWVTAPLSHFLTSLYIPGTRANRPILNHKLAYHYQKQGRYEAALEQHFTMIKHHPKDPQSYLDAMILLRVDLKDAEAAHAIYKKGQKRLALEHRDTLERAWRSLDRLAPVETN